MRKVVLLILTSLLGGCLVGPNYHRSKPPHVDSYTEEKAKEKNNPYFAYGKQVPKQWWLSLESPTLNKLIERGLCNSPDIKAASAVLRQAQDELQAGIANKMFPSISAYFTGQRQKFSAAQFGSEGGSSSIFNFFTTGLSVTYNLDVFGKSRREIEALCAEVDYERYQLEAAHLMIAGNIAGTAILQASYVAQIEATKHLLEAQQEQLTILSKQYDLGGGSYQSVLAQETLVESTRSQLYTFEQSLVQTRHLLATLIGVYPSANCFPNVTFAELKIPEEIPISIPCKLVRQRPDIRGQEALIHQANALIGVATANFFPQFNLTGNYGWASNLIGDLFSSKANVWSMGVDVAQPVWNAGYLIYKKREAIAVLQEAQANYQKTVLKAFAEVADAMKAIENDEMALKSRRLAEKAARDNVLLTKKQFDIGALDFVAYLIAERAYQEALLNRLQVQAKRTNDVVALYQALGGGWGGC